MNFSIKWLGSIALISVVSILTVGCVAISSVGDNLTLETMQKKNTGVAVMFANYNSVTCNEMTMSIGRKTPTGYDLVDTLTIFGGAIMHGFPPQIELAAGTYHVVALTCRSTNSIYKETLYQLGIKYKNMGLTEYYPGSYASFTVKTGEVVNIGTLHVMNGADELKVKLYVKDMAAYVKTTLKKERPKLYAKMTTRLMTPHRRRKNSKPLSELSEAQLAAQCRALQAMNAGLPGKPAKLDCG